MPAKSKHQQRAMCMALAARKGDLKVSELKGAALEIYHSDMTDKEIKDFTVLGESSLKPLSVFLSESILGSNGAGMKARAERWCKENLHQSQLYTYTVDNKGVISGNINITKIGCVIPDWIQWGEVEDFNISNLVISDLKNCPQVVKGNFSCQINDLISLDGCPTTVGKNFACYDNRRKFTKKDVKNHCKVGGSIEV